jgi:hypothetical protein
MPQSYYLNRWKLTNADFNSFADDINDIVGIGASDSGYGQNHLVVTRTYEGVTTPLWDELLTSMLYAGRHQGTTLNSPTSTSDVSWPPLHNPSHHNPPENIIAMITTDIATIVGNKLNSDVLYMTATANQISSSKAYFDPSENPGTPYWTSTEQIYYESRVTFTDEDNRRHFFNSGGELRFSATLDNVTAGDLQSEDWQTLLSAIQTIKLSHSSTESSASLGTPGYGFNMLTNGPYQLVYTKGGTGDYSSNQINIYAKKSGTDSIDIKISFDDAHISTLVAGNFVNGTEYTIVNAGTTDFTLIGATDNHAGGTVVAHTALVVGDEYVITSNTDATNPVDWVSLGAVDNTIDRIFTATAIGNAETLSSELVIGKDYTITTVGSTDFITLGSADNNIGTTFTATGQSETVFRSGDFVIGKSYTISVTGTLDFTTIGAADNNIGTVFTATGTGLSDGSTGEATLNNIGTADYVATGTATTTATRFTATGPGTGTGVASYTTGTWTNSPYSGTWTGTDYVAGTLTVQVDELRPDDSPNGVTLSSPTYSHISQL